MREQRKKAREKKATGETSCLQGDTGVPPEDCCSTSITLFPVPYSLPFSHLVRRRPVRAWNLMPEHTQVNPQLRSMMDQVVHNPVPPNAEFRFIDPRLATRHKLPVCIPLLRIELLEFRLGLGGIFVKPFQHRFF